MQHTSTYSESQRNVLDVCRRVTLMQPLAGRFDAMPMLPPLERVTLAAKVVIEAAREQDLLRDLVGRTNVMESFRELAMERAGGNVVLPQLKEVLETEAVEQNRGGA